MKLKKFFALALAAATLALALTACGSKADDSADNSDANTDNQAGETVTVKLGVVGGIYDDLWASAKAALADEGIDLEIVQFSDYVTPNNALANGDIDLNAFQHRIYLQNEIDNYGYAIQNIGNTFIIPLNLYSQKVSSVDELKDGDVVAIPDDLTNGGRALGVTATGPRLTNALSHAYEAAEKISFEKLHKRSDIGLRALKALAEKQ